MQPEHALDEWREWDAGLGARPKILGDLCGGRSNRSFLLDSDIGRLVLRISGADIFLPGANRGSEARIWQAASQRGIAPPLVFADEGNRYLVSVFIDCNLPDNPRSVAAVRDRALELLESCHQIGTSSPVIDYAGHIDHYWQIIETKTRPPDPVLTGQRIPMRSLLSSLVESDIPTGLCHHDPVIENFVGSAGRLYLIDWEYAASGLPIMDYAALATEWQIDDATVLARTGLNPAHLESAKALYSYMSALWAEATR